MRHKQTKELVAMKYIERGLKVTFFSKKKKRYGRSVVCCIGVVI
jgi:hypothetical protein